MLGGGMGLYTIGLASIDIFSSETTGAEVAAVFGSLAMSGSIPLFISAAKNKGRAEILLRNQNIPLSHHYQKRVPSVGISFPLSRR